MNDWLDVLRGPLPALVPPEHAHRSAVAALAWLFFDGLLHGLAVGAELGAVTGAFLGLASENPEAVVLSLPVGAVVGGLVAVPCGALIAAVLTVVAAVDHVPLRSPHLLHRQFWLVFLLAVAALDLTVVVVTKEGSAVAVLALATLTTVLLLLLRLPGRRLVLAYATASGWSAPAGKRPLPYRTVSA